MCWFLVLWSGCCLHESVRRGVLADVVPLMQIESRALTKGRLSFTENPILDQWHVDVTASSARLTLATTVAPTANIGRSAVE